MDVSVKYAAVVTRTENTPKKPARPNTFTTEQPVITLYGIKNCDTVKKARQWLDDHNLEYHFHDFRTDGLTPDAVGHWTAELGWETLLNKRSTNWKQLSTEVKEGMNEENAQREILAQPTLIKRPLLDTGRARYVGFKPDTYATIFSEETS